MLAFDAAAVPVGRADVTFINPSTAKRKEELGRREELGRVLYKCYIDAI
jgi:hypothetical protein